MIQIRNLAKSFGKKPILTGVDLDIGTGRSICIVGRSGIGKSVFIKLLLGLIAPDSGEITFYNEQHTQNTPADNLAQSGVLFQGSALFDSLRVWENVSFRLLHKKHPTPARQARERAIEKLAMVGIDSAMAEAYPNELSGGMQKRVALARAIIASPKFLFFDEPTTGLDPIMSKIITRLIRDIITNLNATAITITHDLSALAVIADDVAMLENEKIVYHGAIDDMQSSENAYIRQFITGAEKGPIQLA